MKGQPVDRSGGSVPIQAVQVMAMLCAPLMNKADAVPKADNSVCDLLCGNSPG